MAPQSPTPNPYVDVVSRGGVITVTFLRPSLSERELPSVSQEVIDALEAAGRRLRFLVLKLGEVTFMNSSGLGLCINLRNRADSVGATTILFGLNDDLQQLIDLVKVDRLFEVAGDEQTLAGLLGG